ncbi:CBS domain-containing protein [Catellatospora sp. KI3]|uniref:CBS domain-containing protein n=1 Tax=Catellatospora sp. KI3 TaxID=3041620 RepID=UPI002482C792|nr:CBS domain-containing protein [Catellatospora sp. KI3]MDI1464783.1 CBS domain-containing protein [Catellatospora sp. KI3]
MKTSADTRPQLARTPVQQIMSRPVYCARISSLLGNALAGMARHRVRHLVVIDDYDRCVGVIADRAIVAAWAANPTSLSSHTVETILDPHPAVVDSDATVMDAARLMGKTGVDAVAVVEGHGVATGIITGVDLVALLAH